MFNTATPTGLHVTYNAATTSGLTTTAASVTLSEGDTTLTFSADVLRAASNAGDLHFLSGDGVLKFGGPGNNPSLALNSNGDSAVYALDGDDGVSVSGAGNDLVDLGSGNDTFTTTGTQTGNLLINGGLGDDTIDASASQGHVTIFGNALGSTQGAADGNDYIILNHGDTVAGYHVQDYVNGNAGNDTITVTSSGSAADNVNDLYHLFGGSGNDAILGGYGVNSINGQVGDDTIVGQGSNDYLRGGQGNDVVESIGAGNSQLYGDAGNDTVVAGTGIDVLHGDNGATGAGADLFYFGTGTASSSHLNLTAAQAAADPLAGYLDEITDFTAGTDKIHLDTGAVTLVATGSNTSGSEAAAYTYAQGLLSNPSTPAAAAGTHNVVIVQVGSDSYLFSHENGAGTTIDTAIKLDGVTAANVKATDFV